MKTSFGVVVLASVLLLLATSSDAQSMTSNLTGYVKSEDAPVSGATVAISSPSLQGTRTAVADINGYYIFTLLPPGEYTIRVESPGMQTVIGKVPLLLSVTSRFDAQLSLSPLKEAITVMGAPEPVLQTPQGATNIPGGLLNRVIGPSDMMGAAALAPGVSNPGRSPSISGGPNGDNLVMVNGTPVQSVVGGGAMNLFVEDAVQQTTILTSAISAEYGRFTGGVISAVTSSGGNLFSGSIRDSLTNASWTANRPGENIAVDKINSFFGATVGGYAMRDRLWFFAAARDQVQDKDLQTWQTNFPFTQQATDRRYEAKLTAAITPAQNMMGSYFQLDTGTDREYFAFLPIYELSTVGGNKESVAKLISGNYSGVFGPKFVLEARYAGNDLVIQGAGGTKTSDLAVGSWGQDMQTGAMFNAPVFCRDCGMNSERKFEAGELKGNLFFAAPRAGSHSLAAGASTFSEHMSDNNYQSATDFAVLVNGVARPAGSTVPYLSPGGFVHPRILSSRSYILWQPVFETMSRENNLTTTSVYVNDLWNLSSHFTFNVGLRYDRTHAEDANRNVTSDDGAFSPRVTAVYDPLGDGRHRFTAAYNRYVSKISPSAGWAMQTAGKPAAIYFVYRGPSINPAGTPVDQLLDSRQAFQQAFAWLVNAAGGSTQQHLMTYLNTPGAAAGAWFPGYSELVLDTLRATSVDEYVLGYGIQLGSNFYAKADYVDRKWGDFFGSFILNGGPQKTDPFGMVQDLAVLRNTDIGELTYQGLHFQLGWRPQRLNVGVTYAFARTNTNPIHGEQYPELTTYEQKSPTRETSSHRGRAWFTYDVPLPSRLGALNFAVLENYDSGAYYSAQGRVDPRVYAADELGDYSYSYSALGPLPYFFSKPNTYRLEPVTSTDLGINYSRTITRRIEGFLQAELTNALNEQAIVNVVTSVYTNTGDPRLAAFDPRKESPVEGVNWVKDANFGKPYGPASYQAARTYNLSFGLRF